MDNLFFKKKIILFYHYFLIRFTTKKIIFSKDKNSCKWLNIAIYICNFFTFLKLISIIKLEFESENSIKKLSTSLFTFENIFTKELIQGGAILLFISCNSRKIYE